MHAKSTCAQASLPLLFENVQNIGLACDFFFIFSPPIQTKKGNIAHQNVNHFLKRPHCSVIFFPYGIAVRFSLQFFHDGWIDDLQFYVLLTVFQSYQDDARMIMKGCVQWRGRKENPQKLTQLSSRSHPRHLVGKRTAQKGTIIDITSDNQVNSNFPYRW